MVLNIMKIVLLVITAMLLPLAAHCASTTVRVLKLEHSYKVWICREGRHWYPMSPEGPFPKWSDCSVFLLKGSGNATNGCLHYIIGKDAVSLGNIYESGYVNISETNKSLQLAGVLSARGKGYLNLSGVYMNCKFEAPVIDTVVDYKDLENHRGKVVKITGALEDNWHCKMNGGAILLSNWYEVGPKYEFIGVIEEGYGGDKYRLAIYDVERKR